MMRLECGKVMGSEWTHRPRRLTAECVERDCSTTEKGPLVRDEAEEEQSPPHPKENKNQNKPPAGHLVEHLGGAKDKEIRVLGDDCLDVACATQMGHLRIGLVWRNHTLCAGVGDVSKADLGPWWRTAPQDNNQPTPNSRALCSSA